MTDTFKWWGTELPYCTADYNSSRLNERAVEIPVALHFLGVHGGSEDPTSAPIGLEVGNVLSHYGVRGHRVVDRHEVGEGVENLDLFDIEGSYDWIVAISTIEHVRWDEAPKDPLGALYAVEKLRSLLAPGGSMLLTVPTGYHPVLDQFIERSAFTGLEWASTHTRSVDDPNTWVQDEVPCVSPYGDRTPWATTVWVAEFSGE